MARGGKVGRKGKGSRTAGSMYRGSDESDEDYTVDEDVDESEDGYSSFVGDESEESLGEFEDEEFTTKKVKKVLRSRAPRRNKKGAVRPRKRKRICYREDDDGDDDRADDDDEEFTPDCLDENEEFPVMKGTKNSGKPRLRKGTVGDDDGEEEEVEDDEELNPDGLDEEEDFPVVEGMKNSSSKGTAKYDDAVDDEEYEDDEEFTPDGLEEEEDLPVMKEMKNSSKRRLSKGTAKDDDQEDEDEDDEEFTPDNFDDEEEFPVMKGVKYPSKPRLRKGTAKEQNRSRNHKELKKITRKKPQKRRRLKRKARSENNDEFIDVDPIVEDKNKKNADRRRKGKRLRVDSDSDFVVSSGSSDREFTISEEEREQVREASQFCRGSVTISASLKNSSREEAPRLQRKHPGRKAKEKVEEMKTEAGRQICGICLSEEGKRTVRGTLNCCSHYFCFACIMEWSKVESRCPLCKQRFSTISKPARSDTGFDLRTVAIQVPERDQVYQPSEEELRGYLDPYENVLCTECQQGGDDAFMLLCDLCDSPAHTYCVGLGREVPEGNWYCESCRPTALTSSNPQNLNLTPDNRTSNNFSVGSPPAANVRETFDLNEMYVPDTPLTEESGDFQSPRDGQGASVFSGVGAFTVSDRRRIQRQIHQLLNNRRRQLGNITATLGAVSGNSLFGSQIARSRELAAQPAVAQRAAPNRTFFQGRQPDNNDRLSRNWNNLVPERSSNLSGAIPNSTFFQGRQPGSNAQLSHNWNSLVPERSSNLSGAMPNSTFFHGRQLGSNAQLSHNWNNLVPERSSSLSGQLNLNGASTSSQSFFSEFLESELQGADASISVGLVHQQFHPCSSRSNAVPDTSTSPCQFKESTVPTRTLPSTLRRL